MSHAIDPRDGNDKYIIMACFVWIAFAAAIGYVGWYVLNSKGLI